jgi:hypothetical protein
MATQRSATGNARALPDDDVFRHRNTRPEGLARIPILNPFSGRAGHYAIDLHADLPGLRLKAGTVLHLIAQGVIDCDCVYHMQDGALVCIQCLGGGQYRRTNIWGRVDFVGRAELGEIIGRVHMSVAPNPVPKIEVHYCFTNTTESEG